MEILASVFIGVLIASIIGIAVLKRDYIDWEAVLFVLLVVAVSLVMAGLVAIIYTYVGPLWGWASFALILVLLLLSLSIWC